MQKPFAVLLLQLLIYNEIMIFCSCVGVDAMDGSDSKDLCGGVYIRRTCAEVFIFEGLVRRCAAQVTGWSRSSPEHERRFLRKNHPTFLWPDDPDSHNNIRECPENTWLPVDSTTALIRVVRVMLYLGKCSQVWRSDQNVGRHWYSCVFNQHVALQIDVLRRRI